MDASKIVVHHVDCYSRAMVLDFLREAVREPCEAAHAHTHRKIRPFDIARADVFRIGIAHDCFALAADAVSGAIPLLAF